MEELQARRHMIHLSMVENLLAETQRDLADIVLHDAVSSTQFPRSVLFGGGVVCLVLKEVVGISAACLVRVEAELRCMVCMLWHCVAADVVPVIEPLDLAGLHRCG